MKITVPIIISLVLLISVSNAVTYTDAGIQGYVNSYNGNIDKAPDILKTLVGNEKISVDITGKDGSVFRLGFVMENGRISQTVDGGMSDPSIVITTTESAVNNIRNSDNPITAFQNERDSGQMSIEAKNPLTGIKVGAVLSTPSVLQFFGNVFFG